MNYFEQNMECLKQYQNSLYGKLADIDSGALNIDEKQIFTETAINGEQILLIQKNRVLYRLNSSYHPSHEAQIWAEQFKLDRLSSIITMFGMGNGVFAKEIAIKLGSEDYLFVYEPDINLFFHVIHNYDLTKLLEYENVFIAIEGINDFEFHNLLQCAVNITNIFSQIQCAHPYYNELYMESCVKFWKEIRDVMIHTKLNINTEIFFGERLIVNSLRNLTYLKDSLILQDFDMELRKDIPAIIIAAGPSVKANIEELKKAKGKAYLFVVDRIIDYVMDNGIEPDFVVTIDPMKPVEFFSKRENITAPLLTELSSNWEVLDHHKGRKIFYSCSAYYKKMYQTAGKNPPELITGSSVATAAFSACAKLGFEKIVLVGQDLAYDGDFTHAGGIMEKIDRAKDVMVEGIDGKPVRSRYDWKEFITWFNDMIVLYPDITVIDTKTKGAKIQGAVSMPLSEVLEAYGAKEDIRVEQLFKEKKGTFDEKEYNKVEKYLKGSCCELEALKRKSKEALTLCDRQIKEYTKTDKDNDATIGNFKKITKINKYINAKPTYYLLETFITALAASDISKLYQFAEDAQTDKIEIFTKSKKIYQAIIDGVEFTLPKLKEELKQLNIDL